MSCIQLRIIVLLNLFWLFIKLKCSLIFSIEICKNLDCFFFKINFVFVQNIVKLSQSRRNVRTLSQTTFTTTNSTQNDEQSRTTTTTTTTTTTQWWYRHTNKFNKFTTIWCTWVETSAIDGTAAVGTLSSFSEFIFDWCISFLFFFLKKNNCCWFESNFVFFFSVPLLFYTSKIIKKMIFMLLLHW